MSCPKCGSLKIVHFGDVDESHDECLRCGHCFHVIPGGDWEVDENENLVCTWQPPEDE